MICTTCGRDNLGQLVFCQECGQRLPRRGAAPTPPLGVPPTAGQPSPLAATAVPPATGSLPAVSPAPAARPAAAAVRPAAPEVYFAPRAEGATSDAPVCPHCGSSNAATVRFCVTCGKSLAAPAARAKAPAVDLAQTVPSPPPVHEPSPPAGPVQILSPGRVVDVGAPAPAPSRLCPRCRAPSDGSAQFCRLCGASLAESVVVRAAPAPVAAPAPLPVAAPALIATPSPDPAPVPTRAPAPAHTAAFAPRATVPLARPDVPRGSLVLVARDGGEGPSYPLGESTDIGRTEGNILLTSDAYVSPRHARISLRAQTYFLRDLGSANGVYVRLPFETSGPSGTLATSKGPLAPPGVAGDGASGGNRLPAAPPDAGPPAEHPLKDQDLFLVGQQVLRFEVVKDADEGFGVASDNGTLLFGTPASPRYARIVQRTVEGVARDVFNVRKAETILGRESGDIVFTDDPFLSRRHAVVRVHATPRGGAPEARRFALSDLGSSNGTFLRIHEEVRLRSGDQFRIGQQLFRFDLEPPTPTPGGPGLA